MEITLFLLLEIYGLIIGFLCYAALKPVWRELPIALKVFLAPLASFYLVDILCRCTIGWLIFSEPPTWESRTITYLCNSHVLDIDDRSYKNYKRRLSISICKVLNIVQPGHCSCLNE